MIEYKGEWDIGFYCQDFQFENFSTNKILSQPENLRTLIEDLNKYFDTQLLYIHFKKGQLNNVKLSIDETRLSELKIGHLPVQIFSFFPIDIPLSKGAIVWNCSS
jgi:hypothetical protein